MDSHFKVQEFRIDQTDPLAGTHAAIAAWITDATKLASGTYRSIDLKSVPSGTKLLEANPADGRRLVLAAIERSRHSRRQMEAILALANSEVERINAHHLPNWSVAHGPHMRAVEVTNALFRRALPFDKADFLNILKWCTEGDFRWRYRYPFGAIVLALQRYSSQNEIDGELREAIASFAVTLRASNLKDVKTLATKLEQLCNSGEVSPPEKVVHRLPPPEPFPAGSPTVLRTLKHALGLAPATNVPCTATEPDQYPLPADSLLQSEHATIAIILKEAVGSKDYYRTNFQKLESFQRLSHCTPAEIARLLLAAAERHADTLVGRSIDSTQPATVTWQSHYALAGLARAICDFRFEFDRNGLFDFLLYRSACSKNQIAAFQPKVDSLLAQVEAESEKSPLSEGERYTLHLLRVSLVNGPQLGTPSNDLRRLNNLISDGAEFFLVPGEVWSDALNAELSKTTAEERRNWMSLLAHALTATSSRPSAKWLKAAAKLVENIGGKKVDGAFARWFLLVTRGRSIQRIAAYSGDTRGAAEVMDEENATCLRGMLWLVQTLPDPNVLAREITSVAISAYKKVPGVGPRAVKVGNAAVYALSMLGTPEAVGQLAMLKVRVKFGSAQKEIEKAFNAAAQALNLPRDQIEEMGVPSYGLEEVGRHIETLGDYRAELNVTGSDAALSWFDSSGKSLKSVPAKVKENYADDLKELKQSLKDIQSMLPAQRDRIDSMFLLQKSWPIDLWRERYLEHPLIGTIARRLIWCIDRVPVTFVEGNPTGVGGEPVDHGKTAEVTLWHPAIASVDEITAWRSRLEELQITQPFKQAHRELYLLTDAERRTNTYSNRFAAHVIRQHQFNALCAARGWKNKLRLMVDDEYPPASKEVPAWDLRAEFWIEGIGDNYGVDTNDSGTYLRLATDQVRFYRSAAASLSAHAGGGGYHSRAAGPGVDNINDPIPLDQIPPLVFSEIMRDVDLFVGVASIGNDPTWQDGGPQGRYREYWHSYSFGDLSGTAVTRKQVLERLIPRLKIAEQCSFSDRFLVVRGQKRTYKIHLGSGNILMEPNDHYLCIVPNASQRGAQPDLYLPFEGDGTLSIIISKAILLADDTKIKDQSIVSQINRAK